MWDRHPQAGLPATLERRRTDTGGARLAERDQTQLRPSDAVEDLVDLGGAEGIGHARTLTAGLTPVLTTALTSGLTDLAAGQICA